MSVRRWPQALLLPLIAGCAAAGYANNDLADSDLVQAAAVTAELGRFDPGSYAPPRAFCVGVKAHTGDPSPAFMAALAGAYTRLVPLSGCGAICPEQARSDNPMPVLRPCGVITAGDVWFESPAQANVSIKFLAGPKRGRDGIYQLRKVGAGWQVVSYELVSVS